MEFEKMGTGFSKQKKQAKLFKEQFGKVQGSLQNIEATGSAGNGLVTLTLNGEHKLKFLKIKPECVDPEDVEGLEDLIKAAYNDALNVLQNKTEAELPGLGSLGL